MRLAFTFSGLFTFALLLESQAASAQLIATLAGTDWHLNATGLSAVNTPIGDPSGVAVDSAGNVYIADNGNNVVERVAPDGSLTVVAGNGIGGFSGDGGPAVDASLSYPFGLALDAAGNLYIADTFNGRIRKVSQGIITTVAGGGNPTALGDGGPATSASLSHPAGIALDSAGSLYIAESERGRVRMVAGGIITTVAGNGGTASSGDGGPAIAASLAYPQGVAVQSNGDLYISESSSGRVRKVSKGAISTFAGGGASLGDGGAATQGQLSSPCGLAVDSFGNLFISDYSNSRIREVSGGIITTVAGNGGFGFSGDGGPATSATLGFPQSVAVGSDGSIYIADSVNTVVRKVGGGTIQTIAGNRQFKFSGDGDAASTAPLNLPQGIAVGASGSIYISDTENYRIREVTGGTIRTIAGNGTLEFSGDGIPATSAGVVAPLQLAVDASGDVYIAEYGYSRVRKVAGGVISTTAGTGFAGYSGDDGPAAGAMLSSDSGVAVDTAGNVYIADTGNNRIRKVSGGIITTFAGNGKSAFSGDGGPATQASLSNPQGLAVDSAGDVYVADAGNSRIRKISAGTITTVAGNGGFGYSGDGGPANGATLYNPYGIAVDSAGNLFIADTFNHRIRKVSGGIITTVAGNGAAGHSGDGGLAVDASLNEPTSLSADAAGNIYIADYLTGRIRVVLSASPVLSNPAPSSKLILSSSSGGIKATSMVSFSTSAGLAGGLPVPGVPFQTTVTGGSWLSVSPSSGITPGLITVTADPSNLPPETYTGSIIVSVPNASPPSETITVQFNVSPGLSPSISVDQSQVSFTYARTSTARSQSLTVSNSGGGSLKFATSVSLFSGVSANWLSVTPQSGTAAPGNPVALAVRADPSMLPAGTYTGSVTINGSSAGTVTIPIAMTITANPLVMLLSQSGLTFTAVQNGGAIPAQTFGVLSLGSGTLNWSVQTSTLPSSGRWLNATPDSGSSDAGAPSPLVTVSVNPAGLEPGVYYGLVTVVSPGAANTPQQVVAVLHVLSPSADVAPIVQPSSLIFTAPAGVSSPSSQNVLVYDPTGTSKSFRSGIVASGAGQLVTLPTDATISPTEPTQIVVQPIVNGLAPGTYPGTLTLQFSDGRVNAVGITFMVTGAGSSASTGSGTVTPRAMPLDSGSSACTPTKLIPALTTLSPSFAVPVGFPTGLSAQVMDDCGNPQTSGHVTVTFTNGDPPLALTSLNNGTWQATWFAGTQSAGKPVKLTVTATETQPQISGTAEVDGGIGPSQQQPIILPGGVVSAASPVSFIPLAPGGIISIYGSLLADSAAPATSIPLPTTLGNTNVIIAGQTVPLFYASPGQINAVVPFGLNTNTAYSVLVQRDSALSSPFAVNIADAQPGAFLSGGSAIVEDYRGTDPAFLVTSSAPAQAGDVLVIYCAGLGITNQPVADGAASPGSPLAQTQAPVTVSIGGQNANVSFAGLTPTLVGLYQVNVVMPTGVTPGNSVPVMLTVAGQTSPAAVISTR